MTEHISLASICGCLLWLSIHCKVPILDSLTQMFVWRDKYQVPGGIVCLAL